MHRTIKTTISLTYNAKGFSVITPDDVEDIVNLDEDAPGVVDGYINLDDIGITSYEAVSDPAFSFLKITVEAVSTYDGPPEDLDLLTEEQGWLTWPEDFETEVDSGRGSPWTLVNATFENKVIKG